MVNNAFIISKNRTRELTFTKCWLNESDTFMFVYEYYCQLKANIYILCYWRIQYWNRVRNEHASL